MKQLLQPVHSGPPPLIQTLVLEFFAENAERAALWFRTQNPQLGGLTPIDMARAGREKQLRRFVVESLEANFDMIAAGGWLTAAQAGEGEAAGDAAALKRWQQEGRIFAIRHLGRDLFPRYALDASFHPLPALIPVLAELGAVSAWSVAVWFESSNAWLDVARPRERLAIDPEAVLYAAKQYRNMSHG